MRANDTKQKKQMSITSFFSTPKVKKVVKTQEVTPDSKKVSPSSVQSNKNQNLNTFESPTTKKNEEIVINNIQNLKLETEKFFSADKENYNNNNNNKKKKISDENSLHDMDTDSEDELPIMYKKK
eukprot:jgi/Orpsp1_1/1188852/evm.model.d7180000067703.1